MKAILVIDVPDELDYLHLYLEGKILYTTKEDIGFKFLKELSMCVLKPMLQKKSWTLAEKKDGYYEIYAKNYAQGWNDCIHEILGEEGNV